MKYDPVFWLSSVFGLVLIVLALTFEVQSLAL